MGESKVLPDKKYFKIGEVADLVGVEPHVLRYWETQFPQVRPHKARSGHRLYRRREVEVLLVIRELLHVQRFTIAGARQALRQPGGVQALLPRFFDGALGRVGEAAASVPSEGAGGGDGDVALVEIEGLEPEALELAFERESAERGGGEIVEVEVTPLDGPTRLVSTSVASTSVVPMSVAPSSVAPMSVAPMSVASTSAVPTSSAPSGNVASSSALSRSAPPSSSASSSGAPASSVPSALPSRVAAGPAMAPGAVIRRVNRPGAGVGVLPLSVRSRGLVAEALQSSRAIIAILDREDAHDRRAQA